MDAPRLRLGPHFFVVGAIVAFGVTQLGDDQTPRWPIGSLYVVAIALIGQLARRNIQWRLLVLLACAALGAAMLTFVSDTNESDTAANIIVGSLFGIVFGFLVTMLLGAFVDAAGKAEARTSSLAAIVERRFVVAVGLLPFDWAIVLCWAIARGSTSDERVQIVVCLAGTISVAVKIGYLLLSARTIRLIQRDGAKGTHYSEATLRPSDSVPHTDLGLGDEMRVEMAGEAGYRDAPEPKRVVIGNASESIALIRKHTREYLSCMGVIVVTIAGWSLFATLTFTGP